MQETSRGPKARCMNVIDFTRPRLADKTSSRRCPSTSCRSSVSAIALHPRISLNTASACTYATRPKNSTPQTSSLPWRSIIRRPIVSSTLPLHQHIFHRDRDACIDRAAASSGANAAHNSAIPLQDEALSVHSASCFVRSGRSRSLGA